MKQKFKKGDVLYCPFADELALVVTEIRTSKQSTMPGHLTVCYRNEDPTSIFANIGVVRGDHLVTFVKIGEL